MFLDLRDCVLCVYFEKFALFVYHQHFVCTVAKCPPCYVKYKINESAFLHLGEIAEETGG